MQKSQELQGGTSVGILDYQTADTNIVVLARTDLRNRSASPNSSMISSAPPVNTKSIMAIDMDIDIVTDGIEVGKVVTMEGNLVGIIASTVPVRVEWRYDGGLVVP